MRTMLRRERGDLPLCCVEMEVDSGWEVVVV